MAVHGRPTLRDLFDQSPTPHIAHPPQTHHRDYYVATDGSYRRSRAGIGAVIEAADGRRIARLAAPAESPNNNVAEYRALERGLEELAGRISTDVRVGVLVDHDRLASNVNSAVIATSRPSPTIPEGLSIPTGGEDHWDGILELLEDFEAVRAAMVDGDQNPAHPLANAPGEYRHLEPGRAHDVRRRDAGQIPPPSRADRPRRGRSD